MKPLDLVQSPLASRDLDLILLNLKRESPEGADRLATAIETTVSLARTNPLIGERVRHPRKVGVRRMLVNRFHNYAIYYEVQDDVLSIIRILHNARDVELLIEE